MNRKNLLKLVFNGMRKNRRIAIPYLVVGIVTIVIFYIMSSLCHCSYIYDEATGKEAFNQALTISILLQIGAQIIGFFAVFIIFYANIFLLKSRKRELGLYGILGMTRKNIAFIMSMESLFYGFSSIFSGILIGTFLNKIMLLVLYKLIGQPPVSGLFFSVKAFSYTLFLFVAIYAVCLVFNVLSVHMGKPIELLNSKNRGEKEPKINIFILIIGFLTFGAGYYWALSANSTYEAIISLFPSIGLVIVATFCLFTSGCTFFLKLLRKNKKFYYRTKNFISVSNLMFRMKHNAAGLAAICVFSTGVIFLLSCGSTLMALGERDIEMSYPMEIQFENNASDENIDDEEIIRVAEEAATQSGISCGEAVVRDYYRVMAKRVDDKMEYVSLEEEQLISQCLDVYLLTMDDYNKYTHSNGKLASNQILYYSTLEKVSPGDEKMLFSKEYKVQSGIKYDDIKYIFDPSMRMFDRAVIVFDSMEQIEQIQKEYISTIGEDEEGIMGKQIYVGYNSQESPSEEQIAVYTNVVTTLGNGIDVSFKSDKRKTFYAFYGGTFFVGIFMSILFLAATIMIIYYKQISEGIEDQRRFKILEDVGLSRAEAKSAIKKQVMLMFFLPVVTAYIHMAAASKEIRLFLRCIMYIDEKYFAIAIAVVCLIFLVIYAIVYKATSIQYYKTVYDE